MQVSLSDEAQADAAAVIDWYIGEDAFIAAEDFVNELDQAFDLLSRFPRLGHASASGSRTLSLQSFPYSVVYLSKADAIRVIAVAHHGRRPGYWVGRR